MATAVTAVGLGLGSGTAQAFPKHPNPHPLTITTNTFNTFNQNVDNFFDGIQGVFRVGEATPFDNTIDAIFGVRLGHIRDGDAIPDLPLANSQPVSAAISSAMLRRACSSHRSRPTEVWKSGPSRSDESSRARAGLNTSSGTAAYSSRTAAA
jgi:hypothetical protein